MAFNKLPTLGDKPKDVSNDIEKLKKEIAKPATVSEYDAESGTNTVKHGRKTKPVGHYIIWSECGEVVDVSLDDTSWEFVVSAAGKVKVIWL